MTTIVLILVSYGYL